MANKSQRSTRPRPKRKKVQAMLEGLGIMNPQPAEVAAYLDLHPDLAEIVPGVCAGARKEFGEAAELTLLVYRDPEIDDRYLKLRVRLPSYDKATMARLDSVPQPFDEELCRASGYLLVTTDFRPPGVANAV